MQQPTTLNPPDSVLQDTAALVQDSLTTLSAQVPEPGFDWVTFLTNPVVMSVLALLVAFIALIPTIFGGFGSFRAWWDQHRSQKLLEKAFGSELYTSEQIERSTRYYVTPMGANVDPANEAAFRKSAPIRQNLFEALDQFLGSEADRHLLLLADSGMGKTSFLLNYYARNQKKSRKKRKRIVLIPLGIENPDRKIEAIPQKNQTILFLDAFDEDAGAVQMGHRERLQDLMQQCRDFQQVVITCRSQFFMTDEEIPEGGAGHCAHRAGWYGAEPNGWNSGKCTCCRFPMNRWKTSSKDGSRSGTDPNANRPAPL